MTKIFYKYLPIQLDRRGQYFPNFMVKVPQLEWKAVIYDESNYPLKSPNTIYQYGFIDIIDTTATADIQDLLTTIWVAAGMKEITAEEMRGALTTNGYTATGNVFEIQPELTDMDMQTIPAVLLEVI